MKNAEYYEQVAVSNYLKKHYPDVLFTISPQGMKLPIGVAVKLSKMGYSRGTPDLQIFHPVQTKHGDMHGLFIEMKRPEKRDCFDKVVQTKGTLSDDQEKWIKMLNDLGYKAVVCYKYEEAIEVIDSYMKGG